MSVLLTGGAGFIGSHTCVQFLRSGLEVVVLDNLSNSKEESLIRVQEICGKKLTFHKADLRDTNAIIEIFEKHDIDAVIHFAGLKAVGQSSKVPLSYYDNNVGGTVKLLEVMEKFGVKNIVFSSSATVYGDKNECPYSEDMNIDISRVTNPYAVTKVVIERMLEDLQISDDEWKISILRYFNPIGADESALIGEDPNGIPNNLLPYLSQVSVGKLEMLSIFGSDYETCDGTCIRDYIHISDLARGHLLAYENLKCGLNIYNLGTGKGTSVLQMVKAFQKASGIEIPFKFVGRRSGDLPFSFANVDKAKRELNFQTEYDIYKMCVDSYNWQKKNPNGLS